MDSYNMYSFLPDSFAQHNVCEIHYAVVYNGSLHFLFADSGQKYGCTIDNCITSNFD